MAGESNIRKDYKQPLTDDQLRASPVDDGNGGTYQRYTMYEQSQVGQGVKAILQANIDDYPEA